MEIGRCIFGIGIKGNAALEKRVREYLSVVPEPHLSGLGRVYARILPPFFTEGICRPLTFYPKFRDESTIEFCERKNDPRRSQKLLLHEIGHNVWFRVLTHAQRDRFMELYKYHHPTVNTLRPNLKEDFSKAYSEFLLLKKSDKLEKFPYHDNIKNYFIELFSL